MVDEQVGRIYFCSLRENKYYCKQTRFFILSIVHLMCFYNNIKSLEKKTLTIIEHNSYTIDVNVIMLQTNNQSNFNIKKLVVKVNEMVLFVSISLLTFFLS